MIAARAGTAIVATGALVYISAMMTAPPCPLDTAAPDAIVLDDHARLPWRFHARLDAPGTTLSARRAA